MDSVVEALLRHCDNLQELNSVVWHPEFSLMCMNWGGIPASNAVLKLGSRRLSGDQDSMIKTNLDVITVATQ